MKINKQYIYLILAGTVLTVLIYFLMKVKSEETDSTLDKRYSDFAIEDTTSIDKIEITDVNDVKATVVKIGKDDWKLNGKYKARIDAVRMILKTAKLISVKSEVPKAAEENVLKTMAVSYKKVDFYSNGILIKTWYVGGPTRDHYGTYMLLQKPGEDRSKVPYIMEIKGFFGHLSTRFFTEEIEWRDKVLIQLGPNEIKSIEFKNNEKPEYGFKIEVAGKNSFVLYDAENKKVNGFDTIAVRSYLLNYKKIAFEGFNRGILNEKQVDSLKNSIPFTDIKITEKSGKSFRLKAYRKAALPDQIDLNGEPYPWDIEKLYAIHPEGEVIIMQYGTFDKIWRAILNFTGEAM